MSAIKHSIPKQFFTKDEISLFENMHRYTFKDLEIAAKTKNIDLSSIDFSDKEEKDFLLKNGAPKIFIGKGFGFFA